MIRIKAQNDTYLKKSTLAITEITDYGKSFVPKGKEYSVESYTEAPDSHFQVELAFSAGTWFVISEDWQGFPIPVTVPKPGIKLIKEFEGLETIAYPDPRTGGEPWTIGFGTTVYSNGRKVRKGDTITLEKAEFELCQNCQQKFLPVLQKIPYFEEMDEYQQGTLLSFAYNLGANFYGLRGFETISRYLREKRWYDMRSALLLYRNPGSNVEAGLRRRRSREADVWFTKISEGN